MTSTAIKRLSVLSLLVFSIQAEAAVLLQQFNVPFSVEYDSNPTLSSNDKQSIWLYTAIPTYTLSVADDLNRWYGNAGLRIQRSSDKNISIDREDPSFVIGWERELEKGGFNLVANYNQNSTRTTELTTTGLVNQDITATTKSVAADWSRLLTDRLSMTLGGDLLETSYDGRGFIGYITKSIDSSLTYEISDKLATFVNVGYINYKSDPQNNLLNQNSQNSRNYLFGISYIINPQLDISVAAGRNNTSSVGSANLGKVNFNYIAEKYRVTGELERSVAATGIGNFQQSDRLNLGYSYELTEKSTIGTAFSIVKNNSLNSNELTYLNGFYSRNLSDRWDMRFTLDFRKLRANNQNATGEVAGIAFIYNTPEF